MQLMVADISTIHGWSFKTPGLSQYESKLSGNFTKPFSLLYIPFDASNKLFELQNKKNSKPFTRIDPIYGYQN